MRSSLHITATALLFTLGSQAFACTYDFPSSLSVFLNNKPAKQAEDCSVVNIAEGDWLTAGPSEDLGNNRVVQKYSNDHVLLTDCKNSQHSVVAGVLVDETSCGPSYSLKSVLYPKGGLKLDVGSDLVEFKKHADGLNVVTYPNTDALVHGFVRSTRKMRRDEFDLFCGCKLFYPDSAGAKS